MAEWFNLSEKRPDIKTPVLVKSEAWSMPRVLVYEEFPFPRLIDSLIGRHYWYPERMRWTHVPADVKESQPDPVKQAEADLEEMRQHGTVDDATEAAAHLERVKHGR